MRALVLFLVPLGGLQTKLPPVCGFAHSVRPFPGANLVGHDALGISYTPCRPAQTFNAAVATVGDAPVPEHVRMHTCQVVHRPDSIDCMEVGSNYWACV